MLEIFDDGRKRSVDEKVRKIRFDEILRAVARKFGGREGPQLLLDNELFSRSPNPPLASARDVEAVTKMREGFSSVSLIYSVKTAGITRSRKVSVHVWQAGGRRLKRCNLKEGPRRKPKKEVLDVDFVERPAAQGPQRRPFARLALEAPAEAQAPRGRALRRWAQTKYSVNVVLEASPGRPGVGRKPEKPLANVGAHEPKIRTCRSVARAPQSGPHG